jgi:hypothetical protein
LGWAREVDRAPQKCLRMGAKRSQNGLAGAVGCRAAGAPSNLGGGAMRRIGRKRPAAHPIPKRVSDLSSPSRADLGSKTCLQGMESDPGRETPPGRGLRVAAAPRPGARRPRCEFTHLGPVTCVGGMESDPGRETPPDQAGAVCRSVETRSAPSAPGAGRIHPFRVIAVATDALAC